MKVMLITIGVVLACVVIPIVWLGDLIKMLDDLERQLMEEYAHD